MIPSQIVSPFARISTPTTAVATASRSIQTEAPTSSAISTHDVADLEAPPVAHSTAAASRPSLLSIGRAALLGVALLGAVAAPVVAEAHPVNHVIVRVAPERVGHWGVNPGAAFGLGVMSGLAVEGAIPPPVYAAPGYGYNGVGCDGVMHHFDAFGNVRDGSGFYRLSVAPNGVCYRTPARY